MPRTDRTYDSPPCPQCGASEGKYIKKGRDLSDEYVLRYRECRDCGHKFTTAELTIEHSFWKLDYIFRDRQRAAYRKRNPQIRGRGQRSKIRSRLHIEARVTEERAA